MLFNWFCIFGVDTKLIKAQMKNLRGPTPSSNVSWPTDSSSSSSRRREHKSLIYIKECGGGGDSRVDLSRSVLFFVVYHRNEKHFWRHTHKKGNFCFYFYLSVRLLLLLLFYFIQHTGPCVCVCLSVDDGELRSDWNNAAAHVPRIAICAVFK